MIKKLLLVAILYCSIWANSNSEKPINWQKIAEEQTHANKELQGYVEKINKRMDSLDKVIEEQDQQIEIQKIKEKERMLFEAFGYGISKDEVKGSIVIILVTKVHPVFAILYLF